MIDPINIDVCTVNVETREHLKNFSNIRLTEDAKIRIVDFPEEIDSNHYCILIFNGHLPEFANKVDEVWIPSLDKKIELKRWGVKKPIFIMTENNDLLPYCMKDRLASIQDRINKWKEKVAQP